MRGRGFSLIELLVTLGVIAFLLAILLPALGAGRRAASLTAITAHQRSVMAIVTQYATDHDDHVPYYGVPGTSEATLYDAQGNVARTGHWSHPYFWGYFLELKGYHGWQSAITPAGPMADRGDRLDRNSVWTSLHLLTPTAYADPRFFSDDGVPGDHMLRAMRLRDAQFPSDKAIVLMAYADNTSIDADDVHTPGHRRWLLSFADGHSEILRVSELRRGLHRPPDFDGTPFFDTLDGMHGRDK